jgi:hypothetical protein
LGVFNTPLKIPSISSGVAAPSAAVRSASLLIAAHILIGQSHCIIMIWKNRKGLPVIDVSHRGLLDVEGGKPVSFALFHHQLNMRRIGSFMSHDFDF